MDLPIRSTPEGLLNTQVSNQITIEYTQMMLREYRTQYSLPSLTVREPVEDPVVDGSPAKPESLWSMVFRARYERFCDSIPPYRYPIDEGVHAEGLVWAKELEEALRKERVEVSESVSSGFNGDENRCEELLAQLGLDDEEDVNDSPDGRVRMKEAEPERITTVTISIATPAAAEPKIFLVLTEKEKNLLSKMEALRKLREEHAQKTAAKNSIKSPTSPTSAQAFVQQPTPANSLIINTTSTPEKQAIVRIQTQAPTSTHTISSQSPMQISNSQPQEVRATIPNMGAQVKAQTSGVKPIETVLAKLTAASDVDGWDEKADEADKIEWITEVKEVVS